MRLLLPSVAACVLVLVASGCGDDKDPLSPACTEGAAAVETALRNAPAAVALPDGTPLSRCIANGTSNADLENVGMVLFTAAEHLGARARAGDPEAAVQLGFLIGAAVRGASKTNGVMAELQRRIELVGARAADRTPSIADAVARGRVAGEARG